MGVLQIFRPNANGSHVSWSSSNASQCGGREQYVRAAHCAASETSHNCSRRRVVFRLRLHFLSVIDALNSSTDSDKPLMIFTPTGHHRHYKNL